MQIDLQPDESVERALRRFRKQCDRAGILAEVRGRRHYEKPSERRKREREQAARRTRRPRAS